MMPVVRLSDATFKRLQSFAIPLQDSVDDVVSRALDALAARQQPTAGQEPLDGMLVRVLDGAVGKPKLPQRAFREPLLKTLVGLGGKARVKDIRAAMEPSVSPRLLEGDYETVSSGEVRWWNATCWERNDLVKEGILRSDSERGVWELSDAARTEFGVKRRANWI